MYKKILIAVVATFVLVAGFAFVHLNSSNNPPQPAQTASAEAAFTSTSTTPDGYEVNAAPPPTRSAATPAPQTTESTQTPSDTQVLGTATISVGSSTYTMPVNAGETLEQAMQKLQQSGSFTYTSREYAGLGAMVESINGKAVGNGFYWFLYINGACAESGISQTHLSPRDSVEWKYLSGSNC